MNDENQPSYLRGTDLEANTDNSHIMDAEIAEISVSEVERDGASVHIPPAHDIESELSRLRTENPSPKEKFGLPDMAHMGLMAYIRQHMGNLASHGLRLIDKYHASNASTMNQTRFMNEVAGAKIDGMRLDEKLENVREKTFDQMYRTQADLTAHKSGDDRPDYDDYEAARDSDLRTITDYAVRWKTVYQVYMGARVEELAGEVLTDALGLDEWYAHSDEVAARTDYDDPESAGIDLYLPGVDKTVQVKRGSGGDLPNCDADWIVRYRAPDNDGKAGRDARLTIKPN